MVVCSCFWCVFCLAVIAVEVGVGLSFVYWVRLPDYGFLLS